MGHVVQTVFVEQGVSGTQRKDMQEKFGRSKERARERQSLLMGQAEAEVTHRTAVLNSLFQRNSLTDRSTTNIFNLDRKRERLKGRETTKTNGNFLLCANLSFMRWH